jgi:CubicO group peptidase (beta-lactamase class C family)
MTLIRDTPVSRGVASAGIRDFVAAARSAGHGLHSLMLLVDDAVVAEGWWAPYRAEIPHQLHSLTKLMLSTAVGIAVDEGRFSVDDRVVDLFPDLVPDDPSDNLLAMRMFHLLTGSTGHAQEHVWSGDPAMLDAEDFDRRFLALPVPEEPGTRFVYNPFASMMLCAAIERTTGEALSDYVEPRLIRPLGMATPKWGLISSHPVPLCMRTEDLLRLGKLYLDDGVWNGERILSRRYVAEAIAPQVPSALYPGVTGGDGSLGYGYQFWRHRHGAYGVNGAIGQYCIVLPGQRAVLALTTETADMAGVYDLVWEHVLPALEGTTTPDSDAALAAELGAAELEPPTTPVEPGVTPAARYRLDENPLGFRSLVVSTGAECVVTLEHDGGSSTVRCGWDAWIEGVLDMPGTPIEFYRVRALRPARIAARAAWRAPDTLELTWRYVETPHGHRIACRFEGDRVTIVATPSMAFDGADFELRGVAAS